MQREAGAVHRGYHFITEQPPALSAVTGIGREAIDRADYLKLDIHLCVHAYGRLSDRLHLSSSLRLTKIRGMYCTMFDMLPLKSIHPLEPRVLMGVRALLD